VSRALLVRSGSVYCVNRHFHERPASETWRASTSHNKQVAPTPRIARLRGTPAQDIAGSRSVPDCIERWSLVGHGARRRRNFRTLADTHWKVGLDSQGINMEGAATEADRGQIEVRVSTWKYVVEFGVMALLFLFSAFVVGTGLIERDSGLIRDLMMTVFGLIGMPLSAVACHNVLQLVRDSRPALRVTDEGILNRTVWASATVVPWEEIVDIRKTRMKGKRFLEVVLRDPEAYRSRQSLVTRLLMRLRMMTGLIPFPLFLSQLDAASKDVTRQLIEAVEARELSAIRELKRIEAAADPEGNR